ncbi:glycosyltransferase family 2 protein, partial [Acinetobacter baumannii]
MISIGIPFYNAENFLANAIQSVINQSFKDWELILVDDGSTDKSLDIAREFEKKDNRIKVISDGLNLKLPARLNQIITISKYDFIARMDADDIMHPDRLI